MKLLARVVTVIVVTLVVIVRPARAERSAWADDPIWHDGLVEKAVYTASRVVYDKPRAYEAIFFTNKEQHDRRTWTKAQKSTDTAEVWKFNQVEVIPTPNYDYKYVTTVHLTVGDGMGLTRLDCTSQEFCGTSFKQFIRKAGRRTAERTLQYWGFSYMPEAGRVSDEVEDAVAIDSLPLYLRNYPFGAPGIKMFLIRSQKSNRPTDHKPVLAGVSYAGEDGDAHKLELKLDGQTAGTYWMAKDPARGHIMLKYRGADGQAYDLKSAERVNYWTVKE